MSTVFALSSGRPPAGVAVIRITGPRSSHALRALAGGITPARKASLRRLRDRDGSILDEALVLWLPGPGTVTTEDMVELHVHGGRAVIDAVLQALAAQPGLREAEAGEFTRRAFSNGRIDLAEAEGLADLLSAETDLQRRSAIAMSGGALSRQVTDWRDRTLMFAATVETSLDFSDEDDVSDLAQLPAQAIGDLASELEEWLARPRAEALREGLRVVIAGPPNAGKSTLFNALVDADAAITSPQAGTTRDVLLRPVAISGIPFSFVDTAGLRETTMDQVEAVGIMRARNELERADLVLWLGNEGDGPGGAWEIDAQCDRHGRQAKNNPRHRISALTGEGLGGLQADLVEQARRLLPKSGDVALNERQHRLLEEAAAALRRASGVHDLLLAAENFRAARLAFDRLIGRAGTEDMLDALFARFCIGK